MENQACIEEAKKKSDDTCCGMPCDVCGICAHEDGRDFVEVGGGSGAFDERKVETWCAACIKNGAEFDGSMCGGYVSREHWGQYNYNRQGAHIDLNQFGDVVHVHSYTNYGDEIDLTKTDFDAGTYVEYIQDRDDDDIAELASEFGLEVAGLGEQGTGGTISICAPKAYVDRILAMRRAA